VLGLPRLVLETGDGDSEGDGSVGVGCSSGGCNDNGSFDGVPGGVVLRAPDVDDGCGPGSGGSVGCTSIKGFSAFGVLVGERDFGKGMAVGSTSVPGALCFLRPLTPPARLHILLPLVITVMFLLLALLPPLVLPQTPLYLNLYSRGSRHL
jgi:hypothetical protein